MIQPLARRWFRLSGSAKEIRLLGQRLKVDRRFDELPAFIGATAFFSNENGRYLLVEVDDIGVAVDRGNQHCAHFDGSGIHPLREVA